MRYLLILLVLVPFALAEKVDMTPDQLRKAATDVVVAKVVAIYERKQRDGDWAYTRYLAEVQVTTCEKGDLEAGKLAYVRYWRRRYLGDEPPPSTSGHRGLPAEGDAVRLYLARNAYDGFSKDNDDGGLNVFGANGFEAVDG